MALVLIIILGIVLFVSMGLMGHVIEALGWVFEFLVDGCRKSAGCLLIVLFLLLLLCALAA